MPSEVAVNHRVKGSASDSAVCASSGTALLAATCQSEGQLSLQRHELGQTSASWQLAGLADVALQTLLGLQPRLKCQLQLNFQEEASIWLSSQEPGRPMPCSLPARSVCCRPWHCHCCCSKEAEHHCALLRIALVFIFSEASQAPVSSASLALWRASALLPCCERSCTTWTALEAGVLSLQERGRSWCCCTAAAWLCRHTT